MDRLPQHVSRYPDHSRYCETYVKNQRATLEAFRPRSIERHDARYYKALTDRLESSALPVADRRVVCLPPGKARRCEHSRTSAFLPWEST